jgi:hypothetical protein
VYLLIPMLMFLVLVSGPVVLLYRLYICKKLIKAIVEQKGWLNIRIKMGGKDYLVTFEDHLGKLQQKHCLISMGTIYWADEEG